MDETKKEEIFNEALETLNSINYKRYWGFAPKISLPYEGGYGFNFKEIK
jgi:hypothetical protein